jgi:RluA family pseudouridine synthase
MPVGAGCVLEVRLRAGAGSGPGVAGDRPVRIEARDVLYEDASLIAVDKPPGIPTQPTLDPARPSLYLLVRGLLEGRGGAAAGSAYLGIHQRLDRDTSGVVLFTKSADANPGVAALFAARRVEKTYHALVARPPRLPPRSWCIEGRLDPGGRRGRPRVVASGGLAARTDFLVARVLARGLLVEARPLTGRKHQIRVQLAAAGLPILGDPLHGGPSAAGRAPRLMLHAARLAFRHPASGTPVVVESPWPEDFLGVFRELGG